MVFALFVLGDFSVAFGQAYEGKPCTTKGNPALAKLEVGQDLGSLDQSLTGAFSAWATSTLAASGKMPAATPAPGEDDELNEAAWRRDEWSCMYAADKAFDGKVETAWCEGVKGTGAGEVVLVKVDVSRSISIWTGLGKSPALFAANARPRKVALWVLAAEKALAHQYGTGFSGIRVLARGEAELADQNGFQELALPKFELPEGTAATFLAIQILSVYPGKRYPDCCISEVVNPEG
ncbi:MAG: hypothetical protein GYA21_09020 [Myxococcales bacterium]|nr:hypothetical protein [Myxococcales bacterium]